MFIPPHLCLVLFLYSDFCHLGAVSCHNPEPGGTHGRTWRLLGPTMERWRTRQGLFRWNVLLRIFQFIPKKRGIQGPSQSAVLFSPFMSFLSPISTPHRSWNLTQGRYCLTNVDLLWRLETGQSLADVKQGQFTKVNLFLVRTHSENSPH